MRIALAVSLVLALTRAAIADDDAKGEAGRPSDKGTFGIGVILGEPTGIAGKLYLHDDRAIDFAVGAAFAAGGFQIHGDYLFHPWILQDRDSFVLPVYIGPGGRFIDYFSGSDTPSHAAIGLRAVVGLLFDFKNVPLDAFVEVAGVLQYDFQNSTIEAETDRPSHFGAAFNAGAGVRYYF